MQLHFKYEGVGDRPVVVILHGLFGMSDNWRTIARRLADAGYNVYALDLPNHGRSPWLPEFNLGAVADAVEAFVQDQSFDHYHLVGHSLGGKVAMRMALRADHRIDQLIVVDIAPKLYAPGHQSVFHALHHTDLSGITRRSEADTRMAPHLEDFGVRQFLLKSLYRQQDGSYGWRFDLETLTRDYQEILHEIALDGGPFHAKVHFIRGSKSRYILDEDMEHILERFPLAELTTIEDAGHWVHAEQPDAFMASLLKALA